MCAHHCVYNVSCEHLVHVGAKHIDRCIKEIMVLTEPPIGLGLDAPLPGEDAGALRVQEEDVRAALDEVVEGDSVLVVGEEPVWMHGIFAMHGEVV